MNHLGALPRGFGAFPVLEVLDLTYNNLDESTLPRNFFMMGEAGPYATHLMLRIQRQSYKPTHAAYLN
jgi:hypothetical protein